MGAQKEMVKLLTTKHPCKYRGKEVVLRALSYTDDLVVSSLIQEVRSNLDKYPELSEKSKGPAQAFALIFATLKLALHHKEKGVNLLPVFNSMDDIFEASNGKEALRQVKDVQPDAIVMDVLMPECDGIEATRILKAINPQIKIILYSMYPEYKKAALSAGADAFITKGDPSKTLVDTIGSLINPNSDSISNHMGEC